MAQKQRVAMQLPFPPKQAWRVSQGNNGAVSHVGPAAFCWDFVRVGAGSMGAPVVAASSGVVVQVEQGVDRGPLPPGTSGNFVEIQHCPGEIAQYAHIGKGQSAVAEGQVVAMGKQVALVSDTGTSQPATGPLSDNSHLHFALISLVSPVENNVVVVGGPVGTTIASEFTHYEVCTDPAHPELDSNWSYVRRGVPQQDQIVRRAAIVPDAWTGFQCAAVSMAANRIDLFALREDRRMWHDAWVDGAWTGWKDDTGEGTFTTGPAAVSMAPGRIDVFAVGDDRRMWHDTWVDGAWTGWTDDTGEGTFTTGPAAVSMAPGRIDVFAVGDDRRMWHDTWVDGAWTGWKDDTGEGTFTEGVAAVSTAPDRVDLFALGDDRRMWHDAWVAPAWTGWRDDTGEGTFRTGPAALSMAPGRVDLFALGDDRRMWHDAWVAPAWTGWKDDTGEGTFSSKPGAVSMSPGRIDVFVLGLDRWMWHEAWHDDAWTGWDDDTGAGSFI